MSERTNGQRATDREDYTNSIDFARFAEKNPKQNTAPAKARRAFCVGCGGVGRGRRDYFTDLRLMRD